MDVPDQTRRVLQTRDVDVAVHPVDAVNLENHMIIQDVGSTARLVHDGLRSDGRGQQANQPTVYIPGPARQSRDQGVSHMS